MNKPLIGALLATTLLLGAGVFSAAARDQKPKPNKVDAFMRVKLLHSQKVLEGLTTEDYGQIAKSAQAMSLLSQEAQWNVLQTPDYARRSAEFRRSVDALTKAGEKKNLDGATLSFVDVTLKCVECHKYVRGVQEAD